MSGGEKALVGIGVVIGVIKYKGRGMMVLDESDAGLDEKNVERVSEKMREMREREKMQIVIITHSVRTMRIANRLYGATMEEGGITKVVSVRIGEREREGEGEGEGRVEGEGEWWKKGEE